MVKPSRRDKPDPARADFMAERRRELGRLMYERGWEHASEIDWEDADLAALRGTMSEAEIQAMLDEIEPLGGQDR